MTCYVYILRLRNNQLYVGSTEDLVRRLAEHQAGSACRTTALLGPVELVYSEPHPDRSSAVKRERQLKRWSRAKKIALLNGNRTELKRLARCHASFMAGQPPKAGSNGPEQAWRVEGRGNSGLKRS